MTYDTARDIFGFTVFGLATLIAIIEAIEKWTKKP